MAVLTYQGRVLTFDGQILTWGGDPGEPVEPGVPGEFLQRNPEWVLAVGPGANTVTNAPTRQLTEAFGRVFTWRARGHHFAQFSMYGTSEEASLIVPRETDLWVWRDGRPMFRGRVIGDPGEVDGEKDLWQFTAVCYRGMLGQAAALEPPAPSFTNVDQGQIVSELVNEWQARPGGQWGIFDGDGVHSGVNRDETDLLAGTPIAEVIDRIAERDNGFEWEVDPEMRLHRWYPTRGVVRDLILDYGGFVSAVSVAPGAFGNVAIASGDDTTTPVAVADPNVGSDRRGRWVVSEASPSVSLQATVTEKAAWLLAQSRTIESELALTLAPGRWAGPDQLWVGDTAHVRVNKGRLRVNRQHRLLEIQAVLDNTGVETITAGTAGIDPTSALARRIRDNERRVAELERRA